MTIQVLHLKSPVRSLVARPAVAVGRNASLTAASQLMTSRNVSALLVGEHAEAIVTERDLARALCRGGKPDDPIEAVASFHPVTVPGSISVVDAAALMLNDDIRHLVVDLGPDGSGIVSLRALMAVLLQASDPHLWLESLRVRVHLTPSDCWIG